MTWSWHCWEYQENVWVCGIPQNDGCGFKPREFR